MLRTSPCALAAAPPSSTPPLCTTSSASALSLRMYALSVSWCGLQTRGQRRRSSTCQAVESAWSRSALREPLLGEADCCNALQLYYDRCHRTFQHCCLVASSPNASGCASLYAGHGVCLLLDGGGSGGNGVIRNRCSVKESHGGDILRQTAHRLLTLLIAQRPLGLDGHGALQLVLLVVLHRNRQMLICTGEWRKRRQRQLFRGQLQPWASARRGKSAKGKPKPMYACKQSCSLLPSSAVRLASGAAHHAVSATDLPLLEVHCQGICRTVQVIAWISSLFYRRKSDTGIGIQVMTANGRTCMHAV